MSKNKTNLSGLDPHLVLTLVAILGLFYISNDENIIIVHDSDFTRPLVEEFERMWNAAE